MVIFTVILLPLVMTAIPLAMLGTMRGTMPDASNSEIAGQLPEELTSQTCPEGLTSGECFQVYMVSQFMMLFMLIPVAIPGVIAAYSIVGEKTTRSLEPLLATPISTTELLLGKGAAAVIPAVAATWICFVIFLLLLPLVGASPAVRAYAASPTWLLAVFIIGPLMAGHVQKALIDLENEPSGMNVDRIAGLTSFRFSI